MKDPRSSPIFRRLAWSQKLKSIDSGVPQFVFFSGAILMLTGAASVSGFFGAEIQLDMRDPILALPFRYLMLITGIIELFVAYLCLFTKNRILAIGIIVWFAATFLLHRFGLWQNGWHHSGFLITGLNLSPRMMDVSMNLALAVLFAGGCVALAGRALLKRSAAHKVHGS